MKAEFYALLGAIYDTCLETTKHDEALIAILTKYYKKDETFVKLVLDEWRNTN